MANSEKKAFNGWSIFLPILQLIFVTLKLCGVINWSWWWVTLPFWGTTALGLSIVIICFIAAGIWKLCSRH